jgi:autotransporter-associated beta strand protein
VTLGGTNTYSGGTTVNAGTLLVTNATGSATGAGAVAVNSGTTLGGTGSIGGAVTISSGATVNPGVGGIGTLTVASATMDGAYVCDLDAVASDSIHVTGSLTVSGTMTLTFSGTPSASSYVIASYGTLVGTLPAVTAPAGYQVVDDATNKQIKLVKAAGYSGWADSWPGLTDKSQGGDPDGDGLTNLMEYVLGGDPRSSSSSIAPKQSITGGNLVISYKRSDDSETDTTQTGQWSANLASWTNIAPVLVNENGSAPDDMTITIPLSNAVAGKLFGSLKVTAP